MHPHTASAFALLEVVRDPCSQDVDPCVWYAGQAPVHTVLSPDGHRVLLPEPDGWVGVGTELAHVGQVEQLDIRADERFLDRRVH